MKRLSIINRCGRIACSVLYVLILSCCENEHDADIQFWTPQIRVEKGDGHATLILTNPAILSSYAAVPPNPDFFQVMVSEDQLNFTLYKRVDFTTGTVTIDNLDNDKSYYFFVVAEKKGQPSTNSNTVMTIPSKEKKIENYLADDDHIYTRFAASFDMHYLAYFNDLTIFFRSSDSQISLIADDDVRDFEWSPKENRAVYLKYQKEGSTYYPYQLRKFQPETNTSTVIFEIPDRQYSMFNPQYMPSGEKVTFLSTESSTDGTIADAWNIDLATAEKTRITDFSATKFSLHGNFNWSSLADELYVDGNYKLDGEAISIYWWNASSKALTPIIKSQWNDTHPSLSPDNSKIAFASDRSGKDELWMYDTTNQKYVQITGGASYSFDSQYSNIQWLNESQILISVDENDHWRVIKIDVN